MHEQAGLLHEHNRTRKSLTDGCCYIVNHLVHFLSLFFLQMPHALTMQSQVDVLILGAGPAGVMCANALAMAGVNVRIVDQR